MNSGLICLGGCDSLKKRRETLPVHGAIAGTIAGTIAG